MSVIGGIADIRGFWLAMVCPLMTQLRHWLCTAAMFLMPVSAPIKVLVGAAKMPSPKLGVRHEAARVHHALRRCGDNLAACRARTAAGAADGRVYQPRFSAKLRATLVRLSQRAWRNRLRRWPQCGDRIPLRGGPK